MTSTENLIRQIVKGSIPWVLFIIAIIYGDSKDQGEILTDKRHGNNLLKLITY